MNGAGASFALGLEAQERLVWLRQALVEGESSGKPQAMDIAAIKAAGRKRVKAAN